MIIEYQAGFFLTPQGCHKGELCHPFGIWVRDLFNLESFHPFGIGHTVLHLDHLLLPTLFGATKTATNYPATGCTQPCPSNNPDASFGDLIVDLLAIWI